MFDTSPEELTSGNLCVVLQEKHVETAKLLLGQGRELNGFVSQLLDDIANLKAMLHAISIGEGQPLWQCREAAVWGVCIQHAHGALYVHSPHHIT